MDKYLQTCKKIMKDVSDIQDTIGIDNYIYQHYYFEFALYRHRTDGVIE